MVWSRRFAFIALASLIGQHAFAATVLLEFTSPTCGPCREMRPVMRQLIDAGHDVREIDTSREPGIGVARQYRVTDLPTFVVVVDGQERARLVGGGNSTAKLVEMLQTATAIAARKKAELSGFMPVGGNGAAAFEPGPVTDGRPQPGRVVPIDAQPPVSRVASRDTAHAPANASNVDELISATVKLSIDDAEGQSTGTGTVIDAREGKALVLTCGHLFRTSGGKGSIEVALFTPGPNGAELRTTVEGTLVEYDLERDLALVCFAPEGAVTVAPVAPAGTQSTVGHRATSVGCEHGANPTAWATEVTAIDRYQGHPNIEAAKAPVEGRSGGGLFNAAGQLIGVCNAADPQRDEGLYASLPSIHAKLDALQLSFVYQTPSLGAGQTPARTAPAAALAAANSPFEVRGQNPTPAQTQPFPPILANTFPAAVVPTPAATSAPTPAASSAASPVNSGGLTTQDKAMLQEINRRGADSEVICIIQPHEPGGRSEVIKLDRASPAFVRALGGSSPAAPTTPVAAAAAPSAGQSFVR